MLGDIHFVNAITAANNNNFFNRDFLLNKTIDN